MNGKNEEQQKKISRFPYLKNTFFIMRCDSVPDCIGKIKKITGMRIDL